MEETGSCSGDQLSPCAHGRQERAERSVFGWPGFVQSLLEGGWQAEGPPCSLPPGGTEAEGSQGKEASQLRQPPAACEAADTRFKPNTELVYDVNLDLAAAQ